MLAQAGWPAGATTEVAAPADVPAAKTEETAVRRTAASPVADPVPEAAEPAADAPAPESAEPAAARPAAEPERKAPARDEVRNADFVPDPFAGPEPAGRRRAARPGVSLYAQGMVGSNDSDFRTAPVSMMSPGQAGGFSELGASTYRIPFTLGIGARFYLGPRLSLGTGLDYSLLTRTFTGSYGDISGTVSHSLQYLGVPLNLYYDLLSYDRVKLYVYGGGEAEWCLSNRYRLFASTDITERYPVKSPQYSVAGGLGVEFRLSRSIGLYVDPGFSYYFPGTQPRSIRTDKPFLLHFDAGLRFLLRTQKP